MPVRFLSDDQARRYGSFHGDPSAEQLSRFFSFGPAEHEDIVRHRTDRARLGYAVQLGCVRFLGCFPDLGAVPATVIYHVATAIGVEPIAFATYPASRTASPMPSISAPATDTRPSGKAHSTSSSCNGSTNGCGPELSAPPSWSTWPRPGSSSTRSCCPASRR